MERLGIIGCGTMGHSIALTAAWAGLPVKVHGLNNEESEKAQSAIAKKLELLSAGGLLNSDKIETVINLVEFTHSIEDVADTSTFIMETIPEDLKQKKDLFIQLDKICGPDVILATNTSGLSPTVIASGTSYPQRTLAIHFWNPAHLIPLVEVVRGEKTINETVERSLHLLKCMKKKPIEVKKDVPGFVGNRLQFALFREALNILEQGIASKEDIDAAITFGIGRRLPVTGPLMSADMGGLDVFSSIADYLFSDLGNLGSASTALKKMVEENKLGAKTGQGYYEWDESFLEKMNQKRERDLMFFLIRDMETEL